jgi:hypothetical protein
MVCQPLLPRCYLWHETTTQHLCKYKRFSNSEVNYTWRIAYSPAIVTPLNVYCLALNMLNIPMIGKG